MEEFLELLDEISGEMPEEFFQELNGGVILQPECRVHPEAFNEDLVILGEYRRDRQLGRYIVIYYGSFMKLYGSLSRERLYKRLRKTLLHEFRHHLEGLAGEKGLEVEDAVQLAKYKRKGE